MSVYVKLTFLISLGLFVACGPKKQEEEEKKEKQEIIREDYELFIPSKPERLLIIFPCFPCTAEDTKNDFDLRELAEENGVALLMLNFNRHLFLRDIEKELLENMLELAIKEHKLPTEHIYIGGFSGGGNMSLLLGNYLKKNQSTLQPEGIFVVDPPVDLWGLYLDAQKDIKQNVSELAVSESTWILELFGQNFGLGDSSLSHFEAYSPYLYKTQNLQNLKDLAGVKLRIYTEPDTVWWRENRQTAYEDMNAYYLLKMSEALKEEFGARHKVSFVATENKGYRSNGARHPHSWSIVDKDELFEWMKN